MVLFDALPPILAGLTVAMRAKRKSLLRFLK